MSASYNQRMRKQNFFKDLENREKQGRKSQEKEGEVFPIQVAAYGLVVLVAVVVILVFK